MKCAVQISSHIIIAFILYIIYEVTYNSYGIDDFYMNHRASHWITPSSNITRRFGHWLKGVRETIQWAIQLVDWYLKSCQSDFILREETKLRDVVNNLKLQSKYSERNTQVSGSRSVSDILSGMSMDLEITWYKLCIPGQR